jgi:hypothetical protein
MRAQGRNPKIPSSKAQVNFKNPNLKSKKEPLRVSVEASIGAELLLIEDWSLGIDWDLEPGIWGFWSHSSV